MPDRDKGQRRTGGNDDRARGGPARRRGAQGAARLEGLLGAGPQGRTARPRAHRGGEERPSASEPVRASFVAGACAGCRSREQAHAPRRSAINAMRRPPRRSRLLALAACAPRAAIPDAERERVSHELAGQQRYLARRRVRRAVLGDADRRCSLSRSAARGGRPRRDDRRHAHPAAPPERVLPPGTPVRVRKVEFPTGWLIAQRVVMTPRYNPWVYVDGRGRARGRSSWCSRRPPRRSTTSAARSSGSSPRTTRPRSSARCRRSSARRSSKKEPSEGMSARALEMAWGLPEKKRIDRPAGTEEWTWPGGKRRAFFQDDRLVRWER